MNIVTSHVLMVSLGFLFVSCNLHAEVENKNPDREGGGFFDSKLAKRIWGKTPLNPTYSTSLTFASTIYNYKDINNITSIKADLDGIDVSFDVRINNWHALEFGGYYGATDKFTVETRGGQTFQATERNTVPMSDLSDMRNLSVIGMRCTLIGGWNIQKPGFRAYGGIGLYSEVVNIEKVTGSSNNDLVSGIAIRWGVGYTWLTVGVEFWGSVRTSGPTGFKGSSGQGGWRILYKFM